MVMILIYDENDCFYEELPVVLQMRGFLED